MTIPVDLQELIDWRFPDAIQVAGERHSELAYTVWILDLDYSYNEWLATCGLSGRWTLSPRNVKCYDYETQLNLTSKERE